MTTASLAASAFSAPVAGGALAGGQWHVDAAGLPVLAVHGITASHRNWDLFAEAMPERRIVAPDLRGRGRSNGLPGPYGLEQHADDLAAMLDALGIERAYVVGHSMGAFVSVRLAERHPERVAGLALVDGGLPVPSPEGVAPEELPKVLLGPALERLSMTFADRAAYLAFWRRHPALGPYWNDAVEAYVDYDLDGREPELRSSANADAVAVNAVELDGRGGYTAALEALPGPVDVFRAPRGLLDAAPLYPEALVAEWAARVPALVTHEVADVNHYTILMTEGGTGSVIPVIRARIEAADTQEGAT
ncbi:alpha/beta fold hydrolase [Agromyces sp. NPDC058126]|uniref:alpha/beta fold hydrolase n=1 Tax=Agromyces sp. NPDC058126 TaxID=3346350 RepID=UPI0036DD7E06